MQRSRRKFIVLMTTIAVLGTLAWFVKTQFSLEQLVVQEDRLRDIIAQRPWHSFVTGFWIYFGLSLIPGTGGKAIVCGWLFGFWQAMVIVIVALSSAAMTIFSLSRYLIRERIESRYSSALKLMNKHIEKEGALYLLTLRMAHAPFSIINPVSGASRLRSWTFLWTTVVGLLPGTIVWVTLGVRLPSLRELTHSGPASLLDPLLLVLLVASAGLPLFFRWLVGHFGIPVRTRRSSSASINSTRGSDS